MKNENVLSLAQRNYIENNKKLCYQNKYNINIISILKL